MPILIPIWFYEFGFAMHFISAVVAFLLSYFSFKLYRYTRKKSHLLLNLAFIFIFIGFAALTISSIGSLFDFKECQAGCVLNEAVSVYNWIIFGNYTYYLTSLIGYVLLLFSYFESRIKKKQPFSFLQISITFLFGSRAVFILYPFETVFFPTFQVLSSALLLILIFQTFSNYRKNRMKLALLIPLAFVAILMYHILLYVLPFSPMFFALAHLSLLLGFGSLLFILIKVNT